MKVLLPSLLYILSALFLWTVPARADVESDIQTITGLWTTSERDGVVEFYPCEKSICGRFYWVENEKDGSVSRDTKNPDPEKRSRPLCGMQFMGGFSPQGNGSFESGWIYSPRHGSDFSADLKLLNHDQVELRGYFLIPLLGESQIWTRADAPPTCLTQE